MQTNHPARGSGLPRRLAGLGLGLALLAPPVLAQFRPAIAVRCEIPSLSSVYGPARTAEVVNLLCAGLLQVLAVHDKFSFWEYRTETGNAGATFLFSVKDGPAGESRLELDFRVDGSKVGLWSEVWREPGDRAASGDPLPEQAPRLLMEKFKTQVLEKHATEIGARLKEDMPIARARWLTTAGDSLPKILSSLPWQRFKHLKKSVFRVRCKAAQNQEVYLVSQGLSIPSSFEPAPGSPKYDALVVVVVERRDESGEVRPVREVLDEVRSMDPKLIYLVDFRRPDVDIEVFGQ